MELCTHPLTYEEAFKLETLLNPILKYLGSPGDWGYQTRLGRLTMALHEILLEIHEAGKKAAAEDHLKS